MQVAKWGNSLAVRLPAAVVEALGLKEGDDIDIHVLGAKTWRSRSSDRRTLLARLRKYRGRLPKDFKFDRLEANERDETFFDTNVLVYLTDGRRQKRRDRGFLADGGVISVQVLNEFTIGRASQAGPELAEIRDSWRLSRDSEVVPLTLETHERGLDLAERYQLQRVRRHDRRRRAAGRLQGPVLRGHARRSCHRRLTIRNPYAGVHHGGVSSACIHRSPAPDADVLAPPDPGAHVRRDRSKPPSCASRV